MLSAKHVAKREDHKQKVREKKLLEYGYIYPFQLLNDEIN